ncbi:MAG: PIN domain-containing protein [bacterium]|nr:PIN domain-containing protein [bacterium]
MILLDTHVLIWVASRNTAKLGAAKLEALDATIREGSAAVSSVTFWELEHARRDPMNSVSSSWSTREARQRLLARGLIDVSPTAEVLIASVELGDTDFYSDPMDRIIAATAIDRDWPLATLDKRIITWANRTGRLRLHSI